VVIAAVSLTFWWRATRPVSRPLMRLEVELGPEAGSRAGGASAILSPDGTRIVYRSRGPGGVAQLVTRTLDREQTVALPGSEDATDPFFSPDGQSVGFFSQAKLKTISLRGGNPTVLCDAPDSRGASWGEDGSIIAALNYNAPLSRVRAAGEAPQAITELKQADREVTHRWPEVLPGARTVIFTANSVIGNFDQARIEIQSLTTGERKTLAGVYCERDKEACK
jgi:serine/threonine-protein kinase